MKQKIQKQTPKDTNWFEMKAVKTAQSMGKKIIPELYKKALSENFDDMRTLEQWLKEIKTQHKQNISVTLKSGEILEDLTISDIHNVLQSIRERAKIKTLFYIQEYLATRVEEAKKSWNIAYIDDLKYEDTNDTEFLLHGKDSFFDDIQTMIRNYSTKEVQYMIDQEISQRKMHFVDLLEWYKQLPYAMDLDRKIAECKQIVQDIRMKAYLEGRKDVDHKEERVIQFKLNQVQEFEKQKHVLLEDKKTWSKELAIVYRLEQLKEYRRQFETQGFVMLPSRQRIYDEIMEEVLNGNSTLITWHTGTGKTVLAVKISKNLQEKYFENFIVTQELFNEIAKNDDYIKLLAAAMGKTEEMLKRSLGLDTSSEIDEKHQKIFLNLMKSAQKHFPEQIKKKMEEIKDDPAKIKAFEQMMKTLQYNPNFVEVLSGNAWMTVGEISAKLWLEGDGKWGTRTTTQMGKLLKAMSQGKLPIFDEINLVPTDTIMRTKHIFTLKPGEEFSPQEGQGEVIDIKNPTLIATGNLWSKYERNKIDPAVLRLLGGIEATYFDRNETYDIAIISLMDKEWFIAGVDKWFLIGDQAPLIKIIEALKNIEENYMGKWGELVIDNKKDNWLKEAILDIGNFVKMFKNYGLDDRQIQLYTKEKIIKFVTNTWYNIEDRKILITIFAQKWLITENDIPAILLRNDADLTEEILNTCIMWGTDALSTNKSGVSFIDPYELATLDPYNQRNFDKLPATGKTRIIAETMEYIKEELLSKDDDYYKTDLEHAIDQIYQHAIEKEESQLDTDLMIRTFFDLYKVDLENLINRFSKLDHFNIYQAWFLKKKEEHEQMLEKKSQIEKQAEEQLNKEAYNEWIDLLEKMLELDPNDQELPSIIDQFKTQRKEKITWLIKTAEQNIYEENYEEANIVLNNALQMDKNNTKIIELLEITKDQFNEKIQKTLEKAKKYYEKGNIDDAEIAYKEILKYDVHHEESLQKIHKIKQKKLSDAIDGWIHDIEKHLKNESFVEAKIKAQDIIKTLKKAKEAGLSYDINKLTSMFETIKQQKNNKIQSLIQKSNTLKENWELEKAKTLLEEAKIIEKEFLEA